MKYIGTVLICSCSLVLSACGFSFQPNDSHGTEQEASSQAATAAASESKKSESSAETELAEGFPALHSFSAKTVTGEPFMPEDLAAADVTAINIWSTTCAPCVREMPELAEYSKTLPENLRIITWCLDSDISATSNEIDKFMNECGFYDITIAFGDGDMQLLYGQLMYTPTTIFVDAEGNHVAEPLIGAGNIEARYSEKFDAALELLGIA